MKRSNPPEIPIYQGPDESDKSKPGVSPGVLGLSINILFLTSACLLFVLGNSQSEKLSGLMGGFSINFTSIVLEALPFMLIGTLIGGVIEVFVPTNLVDRYFGRDKTRSVLYAGGLGLLFPTCECAIVPIVRRLIIKGVSVPAAICFMLSGPIVNIIVAWSTAVAYTYNWKVVALRVGCGYLVAVLIGLLLSRLSSPEKLVLENISQLTSQCGCNHADFHKKSLLSRLFHAVGHARDDFLEVGKYLIIGAFIAAFIRTVTPISSFDNMSDAPWLMIFMMMIMAVVMNLCSEADAFIAASFRWIIPGSAQLGFMVLGPMLDLKLMMMYLTVFRKRTIVILSLTTFVTVYCMMLLVELFLPVFV